MTPNQLITFAAVAKHHSVSQVPISQKFSVLKIYSVKLYNIAAAVLN